MNSLRTEEWELYEFATYGEATLFAKLAKRHYRHNFFVEPDSAGWVVFWRPLRCSLGMHIKPEKYTTLKWIYRNIESDFETEFRLMQEFYDEQTKFIIDPDLHETFMRQNYAPDGDFESYNQYWNELFDWSDPES